MREILRNFIIKFDSALSRRALIVFCGLFVFLIASAGDAFAQVEADTTRTVEEEIERILEDIDPDDPDIDPELLTEYLLDLINNPININRANPEDLIGIPGVNIRLAQSIRRYRDTKPFESVDELLEVSGIGPATLERMRPYVTVGEPGELTRMLLTSPGYWTSRGRFESINRIQTVVQEQVGYTPPETEGQSRYAGNSMRYYQRYNYRSQRLSLNLTQVKQPGEELNGPLDFDFNSGHLAVQDVGLLRSLVVGDYGIWAGQGLVFYTGFGFGKGRDVIRGPTRNERGLRPYQSSEQTRFMRGVAATVGRDLQVTGFYSYRPLSATVVQGDSVRMPSATGLHRTPTELDRRFNTNLEMYGGRVRYSSRYGIIGASGYLAEYDKYIVPGTAMNNLYDFEGTTASMMGIDYRLFVGNLVLYGEGARSRNGGLGMVAGLEYPIDERTDVAMVYRNYGKDFQSLFGAGFAEVGGMPRNEEGLYFGMRHRATDNLVLSGYFDQFWFPGPRFGTRQSTSGYDWLALAEYRFNRQMNAYLLVRSKIRENDYTILDEFNREINIMGQDARTTIRTQFDYQISPQIRTRTRFEWARGRNRDESPDYGVMVFQDVRWIPVSRLTLDLRMALFETDSFTSRIFTFENDLLYVMSNAALFGQGQRGYILVRYDVSRNIDLWLKYAATVYENRQTVGSGLDESQGNVRSQFGAQVRITF